jgi:hypothetical protein
MNAGRVTMILCLTYSIGCVATVQDNPASLVVRHVRSGEKLPLVMTLASDKNEYVVGETITFTVTITNPGTKPVTYFDGPDFMGFWNPGDFDLLDFAPADESMWQGGRRDRWFAEPNGTRNHLVCTTPVGPISKDTTRAKFTTIPPGGDLVRTETVSAKVTGCWSVAAALDSRQNFHVIGHDPLGGPFGFQRPDEVSEAERQRRKKKAKETQRARMAGKGWRWNDSRRWYEKIEPNVSLGEARSNEITVTVTQVE